MFENLPKLEGIATVELIVDGSPIILELNGEEAPITAGNFVDLVKRGIYDDLLFHRVVTEPTPFVVQGGDPQGKDPEFPLESLGTGGYINPTTGIERNIPLEIKLEGDTEPTYNTSLVDDADSVVLKNDRGTIAMARSNPLDSASSQFYINLDSNNFLDGNYAVFGEVLEGLDVVDNIEIGDIIDSASIIGGAENFGDEEDNLLLGNDFNNYLIGYSGNDTIKGGQNSDTLFGESGEDSLFGGRDNDFIDDILGNNYLAGNKGNDTIIGGSDNDTIVGGQNDDIILGDAGDDLLGGNKGNDSLAGGDGNDLIRGGQGDDLLIGGNGSDTLSGNLGNDTFIIENKTEDDTSRDVIRDFVDGVDSLQLFGGITFEDITIVNNSAGSSALIKNSSDITLVVINGVDASLIDENDFV